MSKSKSKKGREKKIKISEHQQRKKEDSTRRGIRILQARHDRGGGVGPRRNNSTTEAAIKESRVAKRKIERGDTRNKRKTTRKDKMNDKRTRKGNTKNDEKERKKRRTKKKDKKNRKTARLSGPYYVDYRGLNI